VCLICANIETDYPIAPPTVGKRNGIVIFRLQSPTGKPLLNAASGIEDPTAPVPDGKPMTEPLPSAPHKRPDYREACNNNKIYRCRKSFMRAFEQSGCCRFIIDPDNDKCLYQTFTGTCDRGGDE